MNPLTSPLLTDLYQMNMIQAYLDHNETKTAVFEFFVRKLPARRGFLIAAGLEQAIQFLENMRFSREEIEWLASTRRFEKSLLDRLSDFRFTGDVHAIREGRVFFANEPILRITAPMPQAQLLETRLINLLHFQTLIASKAARMVLAAPGKLLVDFGLRRAHGAAKNRGDRFEVTREKSMNVNPFFIWILVGGATGLLASMLLLAGDLGAGEIPSSNLIASVFGVGYLLLIVWLFLVGRKLHQIGSAGRGSPGHA